MASPVAVQNAPVPLCVDLDGTVIRSDMLWESMARLLRRNPLFLFAIGFWFLRGRAYLKQQIARRTRVDISRVPLCPAFHEFMLKEREKRPVLLVTASDREIAEQVAAHLGIFSEVLASDGKTNLRGKAKAAELVHRFGRGGFDYAGNSSMDYPVWESARQAIVVNARPTVADRAQKCAPVSGVFDPLPSIWKGLAAAIRPHQWVKNLIVFVPLITAHRMTDPAILPAAIIAFAAFSLCASSVYLLNDIVDLDSDRQHPNKRFRPLASAALPLQYGFAAVPAIFVLAAGLALLLPWSFVAILGLYVLLTTGYSWFLRQVPLLDVFCLAALYTLRLIGGHEATGVAYSSWLLVFSMFIFLSLALVKRFVELRSADPGEGAGLHGRGYAAGDLELVTALGSSSGFIAVLVLALYVNSREVLELYRHPLVLLLICPLLLYWVSRIWLLAHRGNMHDDPVVFALRDPVSYVIGGLTLIVIWLATGL